MLVCEARAAEVHAFPRVYFETKEVRIETTKVYNTSLRSTGCTIQMPRALEAREKNKLRGFCIEKAKNVVKMVWQEKHSSLICGPNY